MAETVVLKKPYMDETAQQTNAALERIAAAITHTDATQEALAEIQAEGDKQVQRVEDTGLDSVREDLTDLSARALQNRGTVATFESCDDIDTNSIYFVSSAGGKQQIPDFPIDGPGWIETIIVGDSQTNIRFQIVYPYNKLFNICYRTLYNTGIWTEWKDTGLDAVQGDLDVLEAEISELVFNDLYHRNISPTSATRQGVTFTFTKDGYLEVTGESTSTTDDSKINVLETATMPDWIKKGEKYVLQIKDPTKTVHFEVYVYKNDTFAGNQIASTTDSTTFIIPNDAEGILFRFLVPAGEKVNTRVFPAIFESSSLTGLSARALQNRGTVATFESCDDIDTNSIYFVSSTGGKQQIPDFPIDGPGWIETIIVGDSQTNIRLQIVYPYSPETEHVLYRTLKNTGSWTSWTDTGKNTTEIREVSNDTYNNTYNISPSISVTTDTHNWLQAVDTESSDESNKTDMTGVIVTMLSSTGYCKLSPGIFYISGNIDMPYGSTLEGCGKDTIIKLLDSVESGYCVRAIRYNTIRGICFRGRATAPNDVTTDGTNLGNRHGIYFVANRDGKETSKPNVMPCMIESCWFENFDGSALYCHNSGGGLQESLLVNNCYINYCKIGINIDYWSEYHKFSNIITFRCYYACINNGGNNVFSNCTFHGVVGFLIDNSAGDKTNNAHGTVTGCTFNHIDNMNNPSALGMGNAVVVRNVANAYIFTGCQLWYGEINIENSKGIAFYDCLIGGSTPAITVTGNYPAFFGNCIFHQKPSIKVTNGTRFDNCYLDSDGSQITA